uniref:tRNA-dihydrouridine synthase n=1 Tax=Plectus sambesii TaxID=2011161 RepID=A0A914VRZ7_9BILA
MQGSDKTRTDDDEATSSSTSNCDRKPLLIAAPMVRYSKLPFRKLVRRYGAQLVYTPMIISDSFVKSEKCRAVEFTTDNDDKPLIVQFAANNGKDFADATELVANHANGVDLNCGCPQRWAIAEGYGCHLIQKIDLVADIVLQARARVSNPDFSISIKIRLRDDLSETVELCRRAERAGVSYISVHGRTREQRCEPVNWDAVRLVKDCVQVPVYANGDCRSLEDALRIAEYTGVDGVMTARGLLHNPSMYAGEPITSEQCVRDWLDIATETGLHFAQFHQHLIFMLDKLLTKSERRVFNRLPSACAVMDFLENRFDF